MRYDTRHGGPFDRGSADSYYGRPRYPHFYVGDSITSQMITTLTPEEVQAYHAGYDYNEQYGDKKQWD